MSRDKTKKRALGGAQNKINKMNGYEMAKQRLSEAGSYPTTRPEKWQPLETRALYLDYLVVTGQLSLQEAENEYQDMLDDGRFSQFELM